MSLPRIATLNFSPIAPGLQHRYDVLVEVPRADYEVVVAGVRIEARCLGTTDADFGRT